MLKPAAEGEGRRVDWQAATLWVLFLLAPHHYVSMCLLRWAEGVDQLCVAFLLVLVMVLQVLADLFSAGALYDLLLLEVPTQKNPSPPAALAIGYWLTTAGMVVFVGGYALVVVGAAWRGVRPNGGAMGCRGRAGSACFGLCCCCPCVLFGVFLLVLVPLQLLGSEDG